MLKEIQIFEMSQQYNGKPNSRDSIVPTTGSFHTATDTLPHSHDRHQTERKETVCVFCKGGHKAIKCNVVTDPKERLAIVKRATIVLPNTRHHAVVQGLLARNVRSVITPVFVNPSQLSKPHHRIHLTNQVSKHSPQWHQPQPTSVSAC